MSEFTELVDLASERLGGAVLAASDEFFAPRENLLKAAKPVWIEDKYTDAGKWMDGWETRRHRAPDHDWCIIRLGLRGVLRGVVVDTSFFKGNFPEKCSLEACRTEGQPDAATLASAATPWTEVLAISPLRGDTQNLFEIRRSDTFTHLRFHIYPDGGVARLRAYGEVAPDWENIRRAGGRVDLAAVENGGLVAAASDMFFGSRHNLILPGPSRGMHDGWETRRRRGPGFDWSIIRLGAPGTIEYIEVDTSHFKGNFPESCSLEVCHAPGATPEQVSSGDNKWQEILARTKLQAHTRHTYESALEGTAVAATHARFNIYPDGGVARLRLWGRLS